MYIISLNSEVSPSDIPDSSTWSFQLSWPFQGRAAQILTIVGGQSPPAPIVEDLSLMGSLSVLRLHGCYILWHFAVLSYLWTRSHRPLQERAHAFESLHVNIPKRRGAEPLLCTPRTSPPALLPLSSAFLILPAVASSLWMNEHGISINVLLIRTWASLEESLHRPWRLSTQLTSQCSATGASSFNYTQAAVLLNLLIAQDRE